ncbi:MAG: nitrilase-related carbon-nitrogen hydrolase [Thermoplasmatales archaeon]
MRVGLMQMIVSENKDDNLNKMIFDIKEAAKAGANLIVFPEFSNYLARLDVSKRKLYEFSDWEESEFIKKIETASLQNNVNVVFGIYERGDNSNEVYSSAFVINEKGKMYKKYRKSHLFEALGFSERTLLMPSSDRPITFSISGFNFGIIICNEIRFPELTRNLALKGVDAIIAISAWYKGYNKEEQWLTLSKTRALENTVYVLTSNQIGNAFTGITVAVDPLGIIFSRATEEEGMLLVDISRERIDRARKAFPLLKQRRPELY